MRAAEFSSLRPISKTRFADFGRVDSFGKANSIISSALTPSRARMEPSKRRVFPRIRLCSMGAVLAIMGEACQAASRVAAMVLPSK